MSQAGHVVIVGGGVIGASCAYYLAGQGWKVTVLDRDRFGEGCSHGNCGLICPSHVLPLAVPGAPRMALKALLARDAAFAIQPRFDPALWAWFYRFWRRCNARDMLTAGRAIQALLTSSRRLYDELMRSEPFDCDWEPNGTLFVFQTQAALEHYGETVRLAKEEFGIAAEHYAGDALAALEPALRPGLAGAWLYRGDAQLRPDRLMASWRRILEARGVCVRDHCAVEAIARDGKRARAVVTSQGDVAAEAIVVAAGALTPQLQRHLGCAVPIQPGKGYSLVTQRPARCPTYPLLFEEHRVVATPHRSGYRLGSTMEFAGYDATLDRRRLDLLRRGAAHYLHEPEGEPVQEEWCGWRPMTPDSVPLIGRVPAADNLLVAAGHNMLGMSMAPATGKLVAELLSGQAPHVDPTPYAPTRF